MLILVCFIISFLALIVKMKGLAFYNIQKCWKCKAWFYCMLAMCAELTVCRIILKLLESIIDIGTYHNLHLFPKFFQFSHRFKPPISALPIAFALKPKLPKPFKFNLENRKYISNNINNLFITWNYCKSIHICAATYRTREMRVSAITNRLQM